MTNKDLETLNKELEQALELVKEVGKLQFLPTERINASKNAKLGIISLQLLILKELLKD